MGGGGGGSSYFGDIEALINKAKEELRQGAAQGRRNVFISFAFEDVAEVNLLRAQAKNEKSNLEFNDWSVSEPIDSERAAYIKQRIGERIGQSSVTVVYVSERTKKSAWVKWEVEESVQRGKRVIGVFPGTSCPDISGTAWLKKIDCVPWAKLADTIARLK